MSVEGCTPAEKIIYYSARTIRKKSIESSKNQI